ncbi:MAG TPA: nucleoside hydrolase [Planktothrix sp.]|jgi:purine nucleosidase
MLKQQQQLVLHDCDANSDDLITNMVLRRATNLRLAGTVITSGLCYVDEGYKNLRSIEHYLGSPEVEIGLWAEEMPNPFPADWREDSRRYGKLPFLQSALGHVGKPAKAVEMMTRTLRRASQPVTLVCTGPMTVLAKVLERNPRLASKIRMVVIMGGAVRVPGNVKVGQGEVSGVDGTAEWNVFCDPYAFKSVLAQDVLIRLISLDVTNQLPIDAKLLNKLKAQGKKSRASHVAYELWRLQADRQIYLWDPTTAMSLVRPDLFRFEYVDIDVETSGASLGRLIQLPPGKGKLVELAVGVDKEQVLANLLALLG